PPHRWSLQRTDRERPHAHREDPPQRPRIPQHRQLPTTPKRTPRHQMAYSTHRTNTRPPTTVHRVEPKKEHPPKRVLSSSVCCLSLLTPCLRPLPALKAGALEAFTWMVSPVWGLRAVRAARLRTSKVPKPVRDTLSPFFKASVMASMTASTLA